MQYRHKLLEQTAYEQSQRLLPHLLVCRYVVAH